MGRLDGRVALVTGSSRGFGRAIALAFGREGADVAVNYHASAGPAAAVVRGVEARGRSAVALQADVAREEEVRRLIDAVLERFGRLDILVNNAGVMARGPLHRFGSVEDVASCAVFLAAEEAGYLTGQVLHPNGGWVMP